MKRLKLILLLALPALLPASAYAQTFRALNKLEAVGYTLLGSSASVRGEFKVSTTSPSGYLLKASSGTGLAAQAVFAVGNTGNTGVGTGAPQFRLHISSAAGTSGNMVVITTGTSNVIRMTGAGEIYANKYYGDASGLTGVAGDNLGNHIATQDLNMSGNAILNASSVTLVAPLTGPYSLWASTSSVTPHLYVSTAGRVGFGVASPDDAAHVIGQVRLDNDANTTNKGCFRYNGTLNQLEYSNDCTAFQSFTAASAGGWTDDGTSVRLITGTDNVGIGTTAPESKLDILGVLQLRRQANATNNTSKNSSILQLQGAYWNGSASTNQVMRLQNVGNYGPGLSSYKLSIQNNSGAEQMCITSGGNIGVGVTNPNAKLDVAGSIKTSGYYYTGLGAVGTPSYSFAGDAATGIYSPGASQLAVTLAGVARLTMTTASNTSTLRLLGPNGTAAAPAYSFSGDTDTGIYLPAASQLGFAVGAATPLTITSSQFTATLPWRGQNGTAAAPAYSFSADTDNGMYRIGADQLGFATAGTARMAINATGMLGVGTAAPEQVLDVAGTAQVRRLANADAGNTLRNSNYLYLQGAYWNGTASSSQSIRLQNIVSAVTPLYRLSVQDDHGAELLVVRSDGNVGIGTASPTQKLDVAGNIQSSGYFYAAAGAVGTPSYSFTGNTNTGLYRPAAGSLGLAAGGVLGLSLTSTQLTGALPLRGVNGTVGAPAISFSADTDMGLYRPAPDTLNFAVAASSRMSVTSGFVSGNVPFRGANGTIALPTYGFTADADTGVYMPAVGQLGVSAGGALRFSVNTTDVLPTVQVAASNGTAAAPAYSFSSDNDTGMYRIGTDQLGFATGGAQRFFVGTSSMVFGVRLQAPNGSAAAPAYTFSSDIDNGMFYPAASNIGFTTAGTERFRIYVSSFGFGNTAPEQQFDIAGGNLQVRRIANATSGAKLQNSNKVLLQGAYWNGSASTNQVMQMQNIVSAVTPRYRFSVQDNAGNERFVVQDNGLVGINNSAPTQELDVTGDIYASGYHLAGNGTLAGPSYSFGADVNTGIYRPGAEQLALVTNGIARMTVVTSSITTTLPIQGPNGTQTGPAYTFTGDVNTGIYSPGADQLGFVVGGASSMTITTTQITAGLPWRGPNGTLAAPAYSFSGENGTGIHKSALNQLDFGTSGVQKLRVTASSITASVPLNVPYGSAASPGWAFSSEPNTGIYRSGLGTITLATQGADRFSVGTTSIAVTVPWRGQNGSAAAPAFSFVTDPDVGIFRGTANHLSFATNGTERFRIYVSSFGFGTGSALPEQQFDIAGGNLQMHRIANATSGATLQNSNKVLLQGAYWNGSASTNMAMQLQTIMSAVTPRYRFSVQDNAGVERFVVQDNGLVGVNNSAPAQALDVTGNISASGVHYSGNGTLAGPSYSFGADVNTGFYRPGAEQLALVTAGVARMTVVTSSITATLPIQGPNGTLAVPAYTFAGDTNTGIYNPGGDQLGFVVNGASSMTISATQIAAGLPWRGPNGTAALPAYAFSADTNNGLYRITTDSIGLATVGVLRLSIDAQGDVGIGLAASTYDLQLAANSAAKPTSNTWTISSDRRLKKDIKPIERPLQKMLALKGVTYKWKDPSTQGGMTGTYMGLIAQDVEKVFPEWVGLRPDGYKDLSISGFEGLTAEAVKELKRENEELEALLERHGREIDKLEKLVSARR